MLVSVHVEKNGQALGHRQVKCESRMRELDQILRSCDNPLEFMCQVCVYRILSAHDGKCSGRYNFYLRVTQIFLASRNKIQYRCLISCAPFLQTLGFSPGDREHLDNFLVLAFQRNLPPHFNLLHVTGHPHHHRTHTSEYIACHYSKMVSLPDLYY